MLLADFKQLKSFLVTVHPTAENGEIAVHLKENKRKIMQYLPSLHFSAFFATSAVNYFHNSSAGMKKAWKANICGPVKAKNAL